MNDPVRRIILAGAAPDTGNMGVSALFESIATGVARRMPSASLAVIDHGRGIRSGRIPVKPRPLDYECIGASLSKRVYRGDTWFRIRLAARLGGVVNPAARRFLNANAILDVSAGDSFTDLYGVWRFESVARPKQIALQHGLPLMLLPQTYGPFREPAFARRASELVRGARMAWARDEHSFAVLQELVGDEFDPERHRRGVDVAFLLEPREPIAPVPTPIGCWLTTKHETEVIGLNISGLLYLDPRESRQHYGFRADYQAVIDGFVRTILEESRVNVVLVPHVITPPGHYESDVAACHQVAGRIGNDRVAVLPNTYDQAELKSFISRFSWFCGTRMHSTIASLSSGVPTAAIAYSPKTQGVFETCGQGEHVIDPRSQDTQGVIDALLHAFSVRESTRVSIENALPLVIADAEKQLDTVADVCTRLAAAVTK